MRCVAAHLRGLRSTAGIEEGGANAFERAYRARKRGPLRCATMSGPIRPWAGIARHQALAHPGRFGSRHRSGHVFALGTLYSKAMAPPSSMPAVDRKPRNGLLRIGITRVVAAAIEQNFDERGIVWPDPLAPFTVAIAPIAFDRNEESAAPRSRFTTSYGGRPRGPARRSRRAPGSDVADLELIGIPHRITVGERGLKEAGRISIAARHGCHRGASAGNRCAGSRKAAELSDDRRSFDAKGPGATCAP